MKKTMLQKTAVILLLLCLAASLLPQTAAMPVAFYEQHSDWHFDLTKEPDRPMTVEEYIALVRAYSYWSVGIPGESPRDRDGDLPSQWAAPYVCEAVQYGIIDPKTTDFQQPITLGMAMEIVVHSKGLYSFNAINLYDFRGTEELTNEQRLCLNTAVDYGILQYAPDLDVSALMLRKDLEAKYLIPQPSTVLQPVKTQTRRAENYRYSFAYIEDRYNMEQETAQQIALFKANYQSFNIASMDYFYLQEDKVREANHGTNYVGDCFYYDELVSFCNEKGITALGGVIVNYDDSILKRLQGNDAAVDAAVQEIMDVVHQHGFAGIHLDIEITGNAYRALYSDLVTRLSARLHEEGKLLVLSVGGYMRDADEARSMYDYNVIREAADLVILITYDLHSALSYNHNPNATEGEISNLSYTARCMRYAATVIGADKVMIGVGGYGICFNTTRHKAKNITMPEVWALRDRYGAQEMTTDASVDDRYFSYTENGDTFFVSYESPEGIRRRGELAPAYGLAGVAGFYVGGGYAALFDQMGKYRTDLPFIDVDPTQWYKDGVEFAVFNGLMNGVSNNRFDPSGSMTRAMLVTVLWRYEGSPHEGTNVFSDVPDKEWYTDAVAWAAENAVVNGIGNGKFGPNGNITREQMATILFRYAQKKGLDTSKRGDLNGFPDAGNVSSYASEAISWAVGEGIINGSDGKLLPQGNATRAQVATILMRFIRAHAG